MQGDRNIDEEGPRSKANRKVDRLMWIGKGQSDGVSKMYEIKRPPYALTRVELAKNKYLSLSGMAK